MDDVGRRGHVLAAPLRLLVLLVAAGAKIQPGKARSAGRLAQKQAIYSVCNTFFDTTVYLHVRRMYNIFSTLE